MKNFLRSKKIISFAVCFVMIFSFCIGLDLSVKAIETGGIKNGKVYRLKNYGSGKYLNVYGGYDANGQNVVQWTKDGSVEQNFKIVYNEAVGCYKMYAMCSSNGNNRVLDAARSSGSIVSGCNVDIWTPDDNDAQFWWIVYVGNGKYRIVLNYNTAWALTAVDDSNGTSSGKSSTSPGNVYVSSYNATDYQHWIIEEVNPQQTIVDDVYYIKNIKSNKYLDVYEGGGSGSNVVQWYFQGEGNQQWKVEHLENGYYTIRPSYNSSLALAVRDNFDSNGSNVELMTTTLIPTRAQWKIIINVNGSYRIVSRCSYDNKALAVENASIADGANVIQYKYNATQNDEWYFVAAQNKAAIYATTVSLNNTYSEKIDRASDIDWYKITMSRNATSKLRIALTNPYDGNNVVAHYKMELYSGLSSNPTILENVCKSEYNVADVIVDLSNFTTSKTFYLKISPLERHDFSANYNYYLNFEETSEPYGGEIYGWDYLGVKEIPTIKFRSSTGMDDEWSTINGEQISYKTLFLEAMALWNNLNIKGDGTPLFEITTSSSEKSEVKAFSYAGSTARYLPDTGSIDINKGIFSTFGRPKAVAVLAHELGHALGLADLYVTSNDGYYYNGGLIDNTDKLMYGKTSSQLSSNGTQILHDMDIYGVKRVQNWITASYKYYSMDDLYKEADLIVRGTVTAARDYTDNPNKQLSNMYTNITMDVSEYLYGDNLGDSLSFLQEGQSESSFEDNQILQRGEECLLFLKYGDDGNLYILGGPQGRFDITDDGNSMIVNHLDNFKYERMNVPGITRPEKSKIFKDKKDFSYEVKIKAKDFKLNK